MPCAYCGKPCTCQTSTETTCGAWPCAWKFQSPFDQVTYFLRQSAVDAWIDGTGKWFMEYNSGTTNFTLSDGTNDYALNGRPPVWSCCGPNTLLKTAGAGPPELTITAADACVCVAAPSCCGCTNASFDLNATSITVSTVGGGSCNAAACATVQNAIRGTFILGSIGQCQWEHEFFIPITCCAPQAGQNVCFYNLDLGHAIPGTANFNFQLDGAFGVAQVSATMPCSSFNCSGANSFTLNGTISQNGTPCFAISGTVTVTG
jgi:hypothetical protein